MTQAGQERPRRLAPERLRSLLAESRIRGEVVFVGTERDPLPFDVASRQVGL